MKLIDQTKKHPAASVVTTCQRCTPVRRRGFFIFCHIAYLFNNRCVSISAGGPLLITSAEDLTVFSNVSPPMYSSLLPGYHITMEELYE